MGSSGFTTVLDGYILGRNLVDPFCIPIQGLRGGVAVESFRIRAPDEEKLAGFIPTVSLSGYDAKLGHMVPHSGF